MTTSAAQTGGVAVMYESAIGVSYAHIIGGGAPRSEFVYVLNDGSCFPDIVVTVCVRGLERRIVGKRAISNFIDKST